MPGYLLRHFQRLHPHQRGRLAEALARMFYLAHGYRPVRFHGKHPPRLPAQIDLLCRRGTTLLLVEVKYRADDVRHPYALGSDQQQRLIRAARFLSSRLPWAQTLCIELLLVGPYWPFVRRIPVIVTLTS